MRPGQAILQYSGPALAAGSQTPIGYLLATVPAGTPANPTPYKANDLLHLTNVLLNGGTIPATTSDALHPLVAYVGDANGDGTYSSADAALITRAAVQLDSGFAAYPLVDPVIVADTDGVGYVPPDPFDGFIQLGLAANGPERKRPYQREVLVRLRFFPTYAGGYGAPPSFAESLTSEAVRVRRNEAFGQRKLDQAVAPHGLCEERSLGCRQPGR